MLLPQIPTDNLYKFIFVAGLTIIGASSLLYINEYSAINNKLDSIEMDIFNNEINFLRDSLTINFEMDRMQEFANHDSAKAERMKLFLNENKGNNQPAIAEANTSLIQLTKELMSFEKNVNQKKIVAIIESKKIKQKLKKLRESTIYLIIISIFCGVSFCIGFFLTIRGYKRWSMYVQKPTDERIKIELAKLKSSKI
jgi:hypothetical protein